MSFIVTVYPKHSADYATCFSTRADAEAFMLSCDDNCAMQPRVTYAQVIALLRKTELAAYRAR